MLESTCSDIDVQREREQVIVERRPGPAGAMQDTPVYDAIAEEVERRDYERHAAACQQCDGSWKINARTTWAKVERRG